MELKHVDYLYKQMRPYQQEVLGKMVEAQTGILEYDDMGLGKTLSTLAAVEERQAYPLLIVAPKFALYVWQMEIRKWLGKEAVVYGGKPGDRIKLWEDFLGSKDRILITNYAFLPEMCLRSAVRYNTKKPLRTALENIHGDFQWSGIVWDEAHMGGLFNHKAEAYKASLAFAKRVPTRYILTGTPMRKGVVDLYAPLSLVDPERFNSYWSFVNRYCVVIKTFFGREIERNPANIAAFRAMLQPYLVRRTKDEVLQELPGKLRQPLYVEMEPKQQGVYDELTEHLIAEIPDTDEFLITPSQLALMVRQKQILACPKVLDINTYGAALNAIVEHSALSLDEEEPVVIFTPFKKAVPFITELFLKNFKDLEVYTITGGLTAEQFKDEWVGFQESKNGRRLLICVIKSSASFQATAASTAYFLGYEEDFTLNEQAEDRLYRMGQKKFVNIYYLTHKGTVEEEVAARLNEKKSSSDWIVGTQKQFLQRLRKLKGEDRIGQK